MATPNRKWKAGLATLGLFWTSATLAPGQDAVPPLPASMPAPAPPNAPTFAVLLLSNGRFLQGNVSETPAGDSYELRTKGGSFPVPKKDVRKRYGSMAELYEDKVAHLPDRDPDERMKLALWCLEQHMEPQAHDQLKGALAINPGDKRAERMIANIEANAQRTTGRDAEVRVAGAEIVEPAPRTAAMEGMPMPRPRTRVAVRPVIFDLPPDVAMKRFVEFAWDVHPILQASCASCHNEAYQGEYRLIGGKSRRDWTVDVVRANLDATLRHVRRDDPSHSDLVAYASNPHGATPRPAFHGPNDRRYRLLVTWLGSLKTSEAVARAGRAPAPAAARGDAALPSPSAPTGCPRRPASGDARADARPRLIDAPEGHGGTDLRPVVPDGGRRPGRPTRRPVRPAEPPRSAPAAGPTPPRREDARKSRRTSGRGDPAGPPAGDARPAARRRDPADEPRQEGEEARPGAPEEPHAEPPAGPALTSRSATRDQCAGPPASRAGSLSEGHSGAPADLEFFPFRSRSIDLKSITKSSAIPPGDHRGPEPPGHVGIGQSGRD